MRSKKWIAQLTTLLMILTVLPQGRAFNDAGNSSLNWQKVELQQKIKDDLTKALTTMVGPDHSVVNVDIKLKKIAPKVKLPTAEKAADPATANSKKDEEQPANPEADTEALLLSKLGVLVPAHVDVPAKKIEVVEKPEVKEEAPDIFTLIEKVKVTCFVDESIADDRMTTIKKVIGTQLFQFDPNILDISIDRVSLVAPKPEVEKKEDVVEKNKDKEKEQEKEKEKEKEKAEAEKSPDRKVASPTVVTEPTAGEKFEPFKIPVSIFLSFFTIMMMMFMMFKASKPAAGANTGAAAAAPEPAKAAEPVKEAAPVPEPVAAVAHGNAHSTHASENGSGFSVNSEEMKLAVDKFKLLLKTNENVARILVIEWINNDSPLAAGAIKTLSLFIGLDEFTSLTSTFDINQKKNLKKIMSSSSEDMPSSSEIVNFISNQLLMSVLTDGTELSEQNKAFISSLKASEIADLASSDPGAAFGLLNLVSGDLVAQALNMLPAETVSQVLGFSSKIKMKEFAAKLGSVTEKIIARRKSTAVNLAPVFDNVEGLLGQVGPDKEGPLFDALISSKAFTLVEELGLQFFPSELVLKLELPKLNSVFMRMSLTKRAELLVALSDADRTVIYNSLGNSGKLRELIDSEVESIQVDPARKRGVEMRQVEIWKSFVGLVRDSIQSNPMFLDNAQTVLKEWIEMKKSQLGAGNAQAA